MRTISLVCKNRPMYSAEVLLGVVHAMIGLEDRGLPGFDKLIISIDQDSEGKIDPGTEEVCNRAAAKISGAGLAECFVYTNVANMGLGGNHLVSLQRAFEEHESDFNVALEDDAVLSSDALAVSDWYHRTHGSPTSGYTLLSLSNHRAFGLGKNPGNIPDEPEYVVESPYITSPFAWATTKWQFPFIKATWNRKEIPPNGWDFSLSFYMRLCRRRTLHPVVSRCRNVGLVGEHESPESYAKTQADVLISDGTYQGDYRIVARMKDSELHKLDPWMESDHWRLFPQ